MTIGDDGDDEYGYGDGVKIIVIIVIIVTAKVSAGCREPFTKGASLPGSCPQTAGAAPLR